MSEVWTYLKKSLHCKPHSSEVHDPKHREKQPRSPMSQASNVMLMISPVTHEIVLDRTSGEVKICPCFPYSQDGKEGARRSMKQTVCVDCDECHIFSKPKTHKDSTSDPPTLNGHHHECGKKRQKSLSTIEEHDIPEHSVTPLHREDSSWKVIEKICKAVYFNFESKATELECVLKVHSTQKTFALFEECRERVRINAEEIQNGHPRCLVDGNELMRFHGNTIACSLGINDSSSLCTLDQCGVCKILRYGFSANQEFHGTVGVITNSTCEKAIDSIGSSNVPINRKCVIVCRVIAGRINNPMQEIQEIDDSGYDSLAKKISGQSDIEELSVLNPKAVLPCFVVVYRI